MTITKSVSQKGNPVESIIYKQVRYYRSPQAPWLSNRYFRDCKGNKLHRVIYQEHFGEIPPGWVVHHKDRDITNNAPGNLMAMRRSAHSVEHADESRERFKLNPPAPPSQKALTMASQWHGSEEGVAWHKEHAKQFAFGQREPSKLVCEQCRGEYKSKGNYRDRFCSNYCRHRARKKSGVDNEERKCVVCSATFITDRYARKHTCSRACTTKIMLERRAATYAQRDNERHKYLRQSSA